MNNSTIIRAFAEGTAALLTVLFLFAWPVPELISSKDTISVFFGGFLVIAVLLGVVLYVNKRIKEVTATTKQ